MLRAVQAIRGLGRYLPITEYTLAVTANTTVRAAQV